jgi:hypothetical protein
MIMDPSSLAAYIRASIGWNPATDFDLDFDRIIARFPDTTEVNLKVFRIHAKK